MKKILVSYISCISFVSENIRTSNDRESIDEIFLTFSCETLEICGDCHTYVFDVQVQGLCCAR